MHGGATRCGQVTAYRQDAIAIARHLAATGPSKGATVARATGVSKATRMMRDDHYGWFERVTPGVYALREAGRDGVARYSPPESSMPQSGMSDRVHDTAGRATHRD